MPYTDQAIQRLTLEIRQSRKMGCTVLKIIHGYGSSGKGGKIRTESRRYLTRLKEHGEIVNFLPGEKFSILKTQPGRPLPDVMICGEMPIWTAIIMALLLSFCNYS